jgi:hypothetical protein
VSALARRTDSTQKLHHIGFVPRRDSCTTANGNDSRPIVAPTKSAANGVAQDCLYGAKALNISGFDMKYSAGGLSHERIMRCISLYGEKVIPLVREMLAS